MRPVLACILVTCFLLGCGTTKNQAHQATAVDAATTAIGVSSGIATEVNPLISSAPVFLGLMATRVVGVELINKLDEPQRTDTLTSFNSIWWGVNISNILVLLAAPTPVGLVAGAMVGVGLWNSSSMEREFAAICAQEKLKEPDLVCIYN